MRVIRAKTAGFCMGVALALQKLDTALSEHAGRRILTLGPIIHNPQVLEAYARRGVERIASVTGARPDDCVLIRAHGIPREDEEALGATGAVVLDATCPKVKKAQLAIAEATRNGARLLLFGESDHPEVRGLVSYAAAGAFVFDGLDALRAQNPAPEGRYVLASQTTQDREHFDAVKAWLHGVCPHAPVLATICDATRRRQEEIMLLAERVDAVVVVGGRESGNTRRLAHVAAARGVPAWHVETVDELAQKNFSSFSAVGLTAGASTPKSLIDAVEARLETI